MRKQPALAAWDVRPLLLEHWVGVAADSHAGEERDLHAHLVSKYRHGECVYSHSEATRGVSTPTWSVRRLAKIL